MLAQFGPPGPTEFIIILFILGIMLVLTVLPFWMICTKAGFPGWYSLAMLFPLLNIILLFFLAFADWPALRQLRGPAQRQE